MEEDTRPFMLTCSRDRMPSPSTISRMTAARVLMGNFVYAQRMIREWVHSHWRAMARQWLRARNVALETWSPNVQLMPDATLASHFSVVGPWGRWNLLVVQIVATRLRRPARTRRSVHPVEQ